MALTSFPLWGRTGDHPWAKWCWAEGIPWGPCRESPLGPQRWHPHPRAVPGTPCPELKTETLCNFVWMFLRTNSLIWSLSLRNYRCENKHLMGYWKQTTPGMIREKEIFNDLSNICEEGEQRYSAAWIIPLCLNFGFLEVWKECELCIYQQTLTLKASPA